MQRNHPTHTRAPTQKGPKKGYLNLSKIHDFFRSMKMKPLWLLLAAAPGARSRGPAPAAFAPPRTAAPPPAMPRREARRRFRLRVVVLPLPAVSSPLPSSPPSPASGGRTPSWRRRHPSLAAANAAAKFRLAPHPDLWRRSLLSREARVSRCGLGGGGVDALLRKTARRWFGPMEEKDDRGAVLADVRVPFDDPAAGARRLLEECGVLSAPTLPHEEEAAAEAATVRHLTEVLSSFQAVAGPPADADVSRHRECVARVVATIGPAGAKCPRWHADHVPVRLIMSVVGPGCEYIFESRDLRPNVVDRDALNTLEEEDNAKANDVIVPPASLAEAERRLDTTDVVRRARDGEAVLLVGRAWEDGADNGDPRGEGESVRAAVHRSPRLAPGQERILLTVDIAEWV